MSWKRTVTFSFLLILTAVLAITFYYQAEDSLQFTGWRGAVLTAMFFYLGFILLRTFTILFLSFFEYVFERNKPLPSFHPLVTILIPSHNEETVIHNAVKSVQRINYPNIEIIVIDDGSFDHTSEIAKEFERKGHLRVIYKENAGKASALNRGISEALGEYVLCMDADSLLNEDVLLNAMSYFENDSEVAAVAGRVQVGNDHNLLLQFQKLEYITGLNLFKRAQSLLDSVTIIPGPIGVFRKSVLLSLDGYNADTYAEDAELTLRLLTSGYKVKYSSNLIAITEGPDEIGQLLNQRYRWYRGMVQAIMKNSKWLNPFRTNTRNFCIMLYMVVETIMIPTVNFSFALFSIQFALSHGAASVLGTYFIGLTLLDLALTLFSMVTEKKIEKFFLLSLINRLTYGFSLEIIRFFSIFDELFGIPMRWGDLKRKGLEVAK